MTGTPPFTDLTESGVCARIVYQLILIDWRKNPERYSTPADGVYALSRELMWYRQPVIRLGFAAAAEFLDGRRGKLKTWRDMVVERSRYSFACYAAGKPWGLSGAPPVSNTGGTRAALGDEGAIIQYRKPAKRNRRKRNGY